MIITPPESLPLLITVVLLSFKSELPFKVMGFYAVNTLVYLTFTSKSKACKSRKRWSTGVLLKIKIARENAYYNLNIQSGWPTRMFVTNL